MQKAATLTEPGNIWKHLDLREIHSGGTFQRKEIPGTVGQWESTHGAHWAHAIKDGESWGANMELQPNYWVLTSFIECCTLAEKPKDARRASTTAI